MRLYEIAAFIFILNLVAATLSGMGLLGMNTEEVKYKTSADSSSKGLEAVLSSSQATIETQSQNNIITQLLQTINWLGVVAATIIFAIPTFISIFGRVVLAETLIDSLFPYLAGSPFVHLISIIILFIYVAGFIQYWTARNIEY
jgi:hypothetical protein